MKISILPNKLKQALSLIEKIVAKSPTLPILNNVLLETENNFLKLSATDLEIGLNFWLLAKVEKPGKITVPAHVFSNFVSYLPQAEALVIEEKKGILHLSCGDIKTKINGLSAEDFPILPQIENSEKVSLKTRSINEGISQMISFASNSAVRPEITGMYWNLNTRGLTMTATDSLRLGEKKIIFKETISLEGEKTLILPSRSVSLLSSLFENSPNFNVFFSPNLIMFETLEEEADIPRLRFVSKLIEGEYPQYQEIIPQEFKTESIINRKEFLNQLRAASLFASRINEVKLTLDADQQKLTLSCQNSELGEYIASFPVEIKGKTAEVSFNFRFLIDGLNSIADEKVWFAFSSDREGEDGPAILRSVNDKNYLYIVMPIQLV